MHARLNPFPRLRRRARAVLGPVLPVLALAWVGAAGPCVGMAAAPAEAAAHAGDGTPAGHAGDGTPAGHAGHGTPAGHGGHAEAPAQAEAPAHAGSPAPAAHAHGACPHCPAPADAAGEPHAQCGALDDVSDAKRDSPLTKLDLKAAAPAFAGGARVPDADSAAAGRLDPGYRVLPSPVPLHLRHCVLIV